MDDFVVVADPSELVDVPPSEGTASKGTAGIEHRPDLLHLVAHDIVPLAAVGEVLVVEVPSQHVDEPVVEADRVGGPTHF